MCYFFIKKFFDRAVFLKNKKNVSGIFVSQKPIFNPVEQLCTYSRHLQRKNFLSSETSKCLQVWCLYCKLWIYFIISSSSKLPVCSCPWFVCSRLRLACCCLWLVSELSVVVYSRLWLIFDSSVVICDSSLVTCNFFVVLVMFWNTHLIFIFCWYHG